MKEGKNEKRTYVQWVWSGELSLDFLEKIGLKKKCEAPSNM